MRSAYELLSEALAAVAVERPDLVGRLAPILDSLAPCKAGPGFASVRWFGRVYTFTRIQSAIIEKLWQAWQEGTPDVHQSLLLVDAESESKSLADTFRGHPAWGELIVSSAKGIYRLNAPGGNSK